MSTFDANSLKVGNLLRVARSMTHLDTDIIIKIISSYDLTTDDHNVNLNNVGTFTVVELKKCTAFLKKVNRP